MKTIYLLLLVSYIVGITIHACFAVGTMPTNAGQPYDWSLPPTIFAFMLTPALLGWGLAREQYKR